MSMYRLYFLDIHGHFVKARDLEAASDQEALRCADDESNGGDWELWTGKRRVTQAQLTPSNSPDGSSPDRIAI